MFVKQLILGPASCGQNLAALLRVPAMTSRHSPGVGRRRGRHKNTRAQKPECMARLANMPDDVLLLLYQIAQGLGWGPGSLISQQSRSMIVAVLIDYCKQASWPAEAALVDSQLKNRGLALVFLG